MSKQAKCPKCGYEKAKNWHDWLARPNLCFTTDNEECKDRQISNLTAEVGELRLYKSEHERLIGELNSILHPNGNGPSNPSFCDMVSYIRQEVSSIRASDPWRHDQQ